MAGYTPDIDTWFSNVEQHATEGVDKILVGNKCDWEEKRVVSYEAGLEKAQQLGIEFIETSAKENKDVEKAFFSLAGSVLSVHLRLNTLRLTRIKLQ